MNRFNSVLIRKQVLVEWMDNPLFNPTLPFSRKKVLIKKTPFRLALRESWSSQAASDTKEASWTVAFLNMSSPVYLLDGDKKLICPRTLTDGTSRLFHDAALSKNKVPCRCLLTAVFVSILDVPRREKSYRDRRTIPFNSLFLYFFTYVVDNIVALSKRRRL